MAEFILLPIADRDVARIYRWYQKRSPVAASQFLEQLEKSFERIYQHPERFAEFIEGHRFDKLKRFPYLAVFRLLSNGVPLIVTIGHQRRSNRFWIRRLR